MKTVLTKSLLIVALAAVSMTACKNRAEEKRIAEMEAIEKHNQETKAAEGPLAKFEFQTTTHDFGTITEGDSAVYIYKFKNTGEAPLVIQEVKPSCGCTIPNYSKAPVAVGGEGFVKIKFDSNGKSNKVTRSVTVTANTDPKQTSLSFDAMVMPRKK